MFVLEWFVVDCALVSDSLEASRFVSRVFDIVKPLYTELYICQQLAIRNYRKTINIY